MSSLNNDSQLKAGHPPAVKAGGMRITQHKGHREPSGLGEDTTSLKVSTSPPKTTTISGAIPKGNADFPAEAVQSIHKEKPPAIHTNKPSVCVIQQPRK
ncbi:death-associated protein 1 [Agrilus planipennis]|uniref:Death-associated protein 1 n=1 Tax=Agrilus planipennis TaxID=224129 RepID=A0A7F5RCZ8_AGRPL|nr:death-associated protein 1 [Agrilus planipennis]